jgi:Domain of unknown function (DUF4190)
LSRSDPPAEAASPPRAAPAQSSRWNLLAIAALVAGVVGFVAYPIVPSIIAIVLGVRARRQIDSQPGSRGRLAAEAGLVLGWAAIALLVLSGAGLIAVFAGVGG